MPPVHACLVCGVHVDHEPTLCSAGCLREAEAEVQENVATYRRLRTTVPTRDQSQTLRELCVRNGRLTSAIARATSPQRVGELRREQATASG